MLRHLEPDLNDSMIMSARFDNCIWLMSRQSFGGIKTQSNWLLDGELRVEGTLSLNVDVHFGIFEKEMSDNPVFLV